MNVNTPTPWVLFDANTTVCQQAVDCVEQFIDRACGRLIHLNELTRPTGMDAAKSYLPVSLIPIDGYGAHSGFFHLTHLSQCSKKLVQVSLMPVPTQKTWCADAHMIINVSTYSHTKSSKGILRWVMVNTVNILTIARLTNCVNTHTMGEIVKRYVPNHGLFHLLFLSTLCRVDTIVPHSSYFVNSQF